MITLSRRVLISAPRDSVRLYLRDLENMAQYEKKVEKVEASYPDENSGFVEVAGRFLGIPWKGAFKMEFTSDGGFRSEMVRGPLPRMAGGFHLRSVAGGTVVTRDEQYRFPVFMRLLSPLIKRWVARSMDHELYALKEGAEKLHRQLQIRQIENPL